MLGSRVAPPLNEAEMDLMDVDLPMLEPTAEHVDDVNDALVEVHSVEGPLFCEWGGGRGCPSG